MIKFKDFLKVIDLENTTLNVMVDSNDGTKEFLYKVDDLSEYQDYVVGFVKASLLDEFIVRLFKEGQSV